MSRSLAVSKLRVLKQFIIDHPLDPANKYLRHAAVESSEVKNVYDGVVTLDGEGTAVVQLPAWLEAVNADFRYQLTAIGTAAAGLHIAEEVQYNRFKIAGGTPKLKVCWQLTGIRGNLNAQAHPMVVEEEKPAHERGLYPEPELYGQAADNGLDPGRMLEMRRSVEKTEHERSRLVADHATSSSIA